jgi:hypothetical protein
MPTLVRLMVGGCGHARVPMLGPTCKWLPYPPPARPTVPREPDRRRFAGAGSQAERH